MLRRGASRRLVSAWPPGTPAQRHNSGPRINNLGHVVWYGYSDFQCSDADADLLWIDELGARQLTAIGLSNQSPQINDHDDVVWVLYDFFQSPLAFTSLAFVEFSDRAIVARVPSTTAMAPVQQYWVGGMEGHLNYPAIWRWV